MGGQVTEDQQRSAENKALKAAVDGVMDMVKARYQRQRGAAAPNPQVHTLESKVEALIEALVEAIV